MTAPPPMARWRPIVGGLTVNLAFGSLYAWSVFVLPLEHEFGWTRAQTSWVYTIAILVTVAATLFGGWLQDRRGPRISVLLGGGLLAFGYLLSSAVTSLPALYLAFGVVGAFGGGCGYASPMPVVSKWFPRRRGLVVGVLAGGYAAGSALVGPLATFLIAAYGWRATFRLLAGLFALMTAVGAALLQNPPPGHEESATSENAATARSSAMLTTGQLVKRLEFWILWLAFCLGSLSGQMAISQLVPFARSAGLGALAASLAIPIAALGNIGGRILSGGLSDRIGRLTTLQWMVFASALAMPALYAWRQHPLPFFVLLAAVYWCYGTQMSVFASTTADFFGTAHLGMNWGALLTAWGVAGLIGPLTAGWVFDRSGSYEYAFFAAAALALVAVAALTWARGSRGRSLGGVSSALVTRPG